MAKKIEIINGEGKWVKFTITRNKIALNVSSGVFKFVVKESIDDSTYKLVKEDADFDKTLGSSGIVRVNILASETTPALLPAKNYVSELRVILVADVDVDKSKIIPFVVEKSAIHN